MHCLTKYVCLSLLIYISTFYTTASANITDYRFYAGQVHDAQRIPPLPTANRPFSLSQLHDPYRENNTSYSLVNDEYIKFFYVGGICKDGMVGINKYNAQGVFMETIQTQGHIYGLAAAGFLHDNDRNTGTFISTRPLRNNDSLTYIPSTGPSPETCSNLENYVKYISY
jgi:hypothetical protein